ncbi:MAG: hypothetical protein WD579_01415 [Candidatus Paceibacterota bacterium]
MSSTLILPLSYIRWHYTAAYVDYYRIATNFLWFLWHFFAIPLHLKTLFIPWRRLSEETGRYFDLERLFERIIINTIMRVIGVFIRLLLIIAGIIVIAATFFVLVILGVMWAILPLIILYTIINGIILLV